MKAVAAVPIALAATLAAGCGGKSADEQTRELYTQSCASCHALAPGRPSPAVGAPNLGDARLTVEEVRRAIIDGRHGMPAGLVGGQDVDELARFLARGDGA